jgi:hypothetical protein
MRALKAHIHGVAREIEIGLATATWIGLIFAVVRGFAT